MRFAAGCCLLVALMIFERIEERLSVIVFGHARDMKDWRRRFHPAISARSWTIFGRWEVRPRGWWS